MAKRYRLIERTEAQSTSRPRKPIVSPAAQLNLSESDLLRQAIHQLLDQPRSHHEPRMELRTWKLRNLHPTKKLTFLKLAENAREEGTCYPSVDYIAEHIERSPDQTRRLLHELEEKGYLAIEIGGGRGTANRYWLLFGREPAEIEHICTAVARRNKLRKEQRRLPRPPKNPDAQPPVSSPPTPTPTPPTPSPVPQTPASAPPNPDASARGTGEEP